ncbi:uncharacterized protein [Anoplolepis gracilipes]|uniref:uncharacterized protein n=1 Tax=Anoplolepis gracilipes TaxID=354296 RepID=UPI003BA26C09
MCGNNLSSSKTQKMTSMCSSRKSHAVMNTDGYFHRPSPYAYQNDYYLTPRSTWSKVSVPRVNGKATWRFSSAMLIISSILVLIAVLAIAGLALWMGAFRTNSKNAIVEFSCSFRIIRGEKYNPMLKLSTSMVFREKERKFKNIFELLFRRSVLSSSYKRTMIEKFENGTLKVFFRLYLDQRKIPRSIINVEDTVKDIIVKETYSISSLFQDMELDLTTVTVKRINKEEKQKIGIINQKQEQQKHAMITKNSLLRPNRTSSLIMNSKSKTHTVRPIKDSNEPDIDFDNIPTIKGTYRATKVNVTAYNSTKGTSVSIADIKGTTKKMLSHEQTTRSDKTSNSIKYLPTDIPSISVTKSMTITLNKEKLNKKQEDEIKTLLTISTTQNTVDIFKDFRNPDLETSPWKPIIPAYVNTEFKLLPDGNIKKADRIESSTQNIVPLTSDLHNNIKQLDDKTSTTPSAILGLLGSVNFHDISTIDTDIIGFPRDRIVPDLTKSTSDDNEKPDIEVAGQLPSETYNVKLKISSKYDGNDNKTSSSKSLLTHNISENMSIQDNPLFQKKYTDSNTTQKTEEKFDNLASTIEPDNIESFYNEKNSSESPTHGIGIAEPVPDIEIELETKNRNSSILILRQENEKYALRDKKVNINLPQPIYTSYNTPDLNGGNFGSSLIENLATKNPFRHTIPVDKIMSAINYNDNNSSHYSDNLFVSNDEIDEESSVSQDKIMTTLLPDSEEIIDETFVTKQDDTTVQLPNYEQIISTEPNIIQNNERDDELSHLNTTESYSDSTRKLTVENLDDKKSVSRNSTFIEIDIVEHTPGQSKRNSESYADETIAGKDELKKVYNDTLKAYVVKNRVTLVPANNNNAEIIKSVQLRSKIDSPAEGTTPLKQLSGMNNYTHKRDINTESAVSERFSSHEIQPDSTRFSEKESSKHNSTIIEQIVEIVTSISTRVSSNVKSNPVVSKIITRSSTNPIIRSEKISASNNEADRLFGDAVNTTKKALSSVQERPSLSSKNMRIMQTSDKKMLTFENQILLEKLKQLAEIRTDDDFVQVKRNKSNSNRMSQHQNFNASSLNIDELKKIANVMTENKTLKNANLRITFSRDDVAIFTKILNKIPPCPTDETNETLTTIRPDFSKTPRSNNYRTARSNVPKRVKEY